MSFTSPRTLAFRSAEGVWLVAGGKGGVGTSTVTALLALASARPAAPALLVDADAQFGVQHLLFGLPPSPGLSALRGGTDPEALPIRVTEGLMLLCGGPRGDEAPLRAAEFEGALRRLSPLFRAFGTTLVDVGSRLAAVTAGLGAGGKRLVAVCEPDRLAIAATYALVKHAWARVPSLPIQVVMNRATPGEARAAFDQLAEASARFLGRTPELAGSVPRDPVLGTPIGGHPFLHEDVSSGPALEAARLMEERIRFRGRRATEARAFEQRRM